MHVETLKCVYTKVYEHENSSKEIQADCFGFRSFLLPRVSSTHEDLAEEQVLGLLRFSAAQREENRGINSFRTISISGQFFRMTDTAVPGCET